MKILIVLLITLFPLFPLIVMSKSICLKDIENFMGKEERKLKKDLKKAIIQGSSLVELRLIIVRYKDKGGEKEKALFVLESIVNNSLLDSEDVILDLMDFVVGHCASHMKVWE